MPVRPVQRPDHPEAAIKILIVGLSAALLAFSAVTFVYLGTSWLAVRTSPAGPAGVTYLVPTWN